MDRALGGTRQPERRGRARHPAIVAEFGGELSLIKGTAGATFQIVLRRMP